MKNNRYCFRPLSGSKVSEQIKCITLSHIFKVFVPSRGVRYLNSISCVALDTIYYI